MRVLFIGVYRDGTGWAQAAVDYVLALDAAGVDVVPRVLKLNDRRVRLPARLLELESKSSRGCDVVIQHVLPSQMEYHAGLLNVGLFASETSDFRASGWADRLNLMDEVWVVNAQQVEACRDSGVTRPVRVTPHATDVSRFQRSHRPLDPLREYKDRGEFLFYSIGEMVRRKNLPALLKAFHLEFDPSEPVRLVVKTDPPGRHPHQNVHLLCEEIKKGLRLHGSPEAYKAEVVITDRLTDEGVMRLHAACDCFVLPSFGEAWSIPCFDAMGMGRTPIATGWGGHTDYLSRANGWLADYRMEPAFGAVDTLPGLYVGAENWASVDVNHLRRCMREAYENKDLKADKADKGIENAFDYSHEAIGFLLKNLLAQAQGESHERRSLQDVAGTA